MKNLLGGLLLVLGIAGGLQASVGLPESMPVRFADGTQYSYATATLLKFTTIQQMVEDLGYDDSVVLPILCTRQQFDILFKMAEQEDPVVRGIQDYKELVWLLKWVMLLDNTVLEKALALDLFKRLNFAPADRRQEMFNYIANVNFYIFFVIAKTIAPLVMEGSGFFIPSTILEQRLGIPFGDITYFVYQGLNEDGNAVIREGRLQDIRQQLRGGSFTKDELESGNMRFLMIKMFLGDGPTWGSLSEKNKELLKKVFGDGLKMPNEHLLVRLGTDVYPQLVQQVFADGSTPLIRAFKYMQPDDVVEKIIEINPATINAQESDGGTALMYAVAGNHLDLVKILLAKGANPFMHNKKGVTVSTIAYLHANPDIIALLPPVDSSDPVQRKHLLQNLYRAVQQADLGVIKAILSLGISPNEYADARDTIGVEAAKLLSLPQTDQDLQNNIKEVVRFLVNNYPDLDLTSRFDPHQNYYQAALQCADTEEVYQLLFLNYLKAAEQEIGISYEKIKREEFCRRSKRPRVR